MKEQERDRVRDWTGSAPLLHNANPCHLNRAIRPRRKVGQIVDSGK
jgi:hypothetical protein